MIANGVVQNISAKNLTPITDDERTVILALRERGFSYPAIGQKMGRSKGAIERLCNNARDAGELKPIVYQPREAVQRAIEMTERRPLPRLGLNMTESEERAVASLQNTLRNKTKLELLTMVRSRMQK
jgi:IS30 family transposase